MEKGKKWIEGMPKVELHCHLDGSLSEQTILFLSKKEKIILPHDWRNKIRAGEDCESLAHYLECFDLPIQCLKTGEDFYEAVRNVYEEAAREHVMYMEVRFAPMLSVCENVNAESIVEGAVEGLKRARKEFQIGGNLILCCMRNQEEWKNEEVLRLAEKYQGNGVCAVDLAGDETAYPTKKFKDLFAKAKKKGLIYTIHAGECHRTEDIFAALEYGTKRIGHGIAMQGVKRLQEICREKKIGIELCPTSNLQTKAVKDLENYPIGEFVKEGLLVSVNTDNRMVSGTTLSEELWKVQNGFHITPQLLTENAIETSFAGEKEKEQMRKQLWEYCR